MCTVPFPSLFLLGLIIPPFSPFPEIPPPRGRDPAYTYSLFLASFAHAGGTDCLISGNIAVRAPTPRYAWENARRLLRCVDF